MTANTTANEFFNTTVHGPYTMLRTEHGFTIKNAPGTKAKLYLDPFEDNAEVTVSMASTGEMTADEVRDLCNQMNCAASAAEVFTNVIKTFEKVGSHLAEQQ